MGARVWEIPVRTGVRPGPRSCRRSWMFQAPAAARCQMDNASDRTSAAAVAPVCDCGKQSPSDKNVVKWTTTGGLLASLGICAACCHLPFAVISVGIGGALVSTLDAFAPYKWIFIALTTALLGYGFYAVYWRLQRTSAAGAECPMCGSGRSVRIGLWAATILAISGIVFEQIEPLPGWLERNCCAASR
jgi:mercuric ion transport protein